MSAPPRPGSSSRGTPSPRRGSRLRLHPAQVCFVVDDVSAAVDESVERFGWGPFHRFTAPVAEARYGGWSGPKKTDVALGMAGAVQVELVHVHEGHDTVEAYQTRYGAGFQHLGIHCRDREQAIASLEALGARVDDQGEYSNIRFAFLDTPTGPGMWELLDTARDTPPPGASAEDSTRRPAPPARPEPLVTIDRATIVTADLDRAYAFYAQAFGWEDVRTETRTVRFGAADAVVRRARGQAGRLLLELVEPVPGEENPYARHLARGDHGLVHAGGVRAGGDPTDGAVLTGAWLEDEEVFGLHAWSGGSGTLQIRRADA